MIEPTDVLVLVPVGAVITCVVNALRKRSVPDERRCTECEEAIRYLLCFDGRCRYHCRQKCRCEEG